jgi:[NiFe] hydrogenase assembly HybE family chaperone
MAGMPMLNPALRVQAVGFRPWQAHWLGVLVTPWFMNLVWLPLPEPASAAPSPRPPAEPATPVGVTRTRAVGCERFDFIGAHEPGFGAFEACSLFSPMADFADQEAAIATAEQVMIQLHAPTPPQPADAASDAARDPASETPLGPGSAPSRRALLFGRAAAAARESGR